MKNLSKLKSPPSFFQSSQEGIGFHVDSPSMPASSPVGIVSFPNKLLLTGAVTFSQIEIEFLSRLAYRKKTLGRNAKAMANMLRLLALVESNKSGRSFVPLPFKLLEKMFKSGAAVDNLLKCAVNGGVLETNNHYNPERKLCKSYRFTEQWGFLNIHQITRKDIPAAEVVNQVFKGMKEIRKSKPKTLTEDEELEELLRATN
jgi:hypothetical protein